jgi:predicted neutral ceramidase superfamily lipid hydrolase
MAKTMKKITIQLIIFTIIVAILSAALFLTLLKEYYFQIFPLSVIIFFALTLLFFFLIVKRGENNPNKFVRMFLLSMTIKIFTLLIYLTGYLLYDRSEAVPFLISFLVLYLIFTIFEVFSAVRISKTHRK